MTFLSLVYLKGVHCQQGSSCGNLGWED